MSNYQSALKLVGLGVLLLMASTIPSQASSSDGITKLIQVAHRNAKRAKDEALTAAERQKELVQKKRESSTKEVIKSLSPGKPLFFYTILLIAIFVGIACSVLRRSRARERLKAMREEAEDFFRDLQLRKKLPVVFVDIVLKKGEVAIFDEPSTLYETRAYRVYGGGGTRIRGVYIGGGASESHQRLREIDSGRIILTNQRLIFDGSTENRALNLADIISASSWSDAIEISSSRRQRSQIYTVSNPIIWQQVIQMLASGQISVDLSSTQSRDSEGWQL